MEGFDMEAKVEDKDGIYIVNLIGKLDFESADSLKSRCLQTFVNQSVIFNLQKLNFVGSSGITPFLELLSALSKTSGAKFKICSVGVEFMRLFETGAVDGIEIYRDVNDAHKAFSSPEVQAMARLKPFGLGLNLE
jgi:anti-anti-sigma factor